MEFQYVALDKNGQHVSATATADSVAALISRLKNKGFIPLRVSETRQASAQISKIKKIFIPQITSKELVVFTRQLATILNSGVLLTDAIMTIAEDMDNQYFCDILKDVWTDINGGKTLSLALSKYPIFPTTYTAVVKSGEEVGNLGNTLMGLAKYLEDSERTKEKIVNAMRYPTFLFLFMLLIVSAMVIFLIPKFSRLFSNAGVELPLLTRIVVGFSDFCLKNAALEILGITGLGFLVWHLLKNPEIRYKFDYYILKLPIIGNLALKALISQFCRTFGILISGGVSMVAALAVSSDVMKNLYLNNIIDQVRAKVISGEALSDAMKAHKMMPRIMVKMIAVGEKSGKLDEMLTKTSDYYDRDLESALDGFTSLLEPVFVVLIGGIVLIVALALYLPIFKLSATAH
ncbi:MAG: type II secretion system F family protein [Candidatus Omnitrophica bacterium]|nr:type II secretion system F family protein [Candidatus Omnitrophota bacterium]